MAKTVAVQDPENIIPVNVLAEEIVAISQGIKKLRAGRLNDEALLLLIQNAAPRQGHRNTKPIPRKVVLDVLKGIEDLEATYLKTKPKK